MSTVKANRVQIGQSATATQNFSLEQPAVPDGTVKLVRGNAGSGSQDILTVDASGKVAFPQNTQTWQAFYVPAQRQSATTYTNTTGQPIAVAVVAISSGASGYHTLQLDCDGIVLNKFVSSLGVANEFISVYGVIPANSTYSVTLLGDGTPSFISWRELR